MNLDFFDFPTKNTKNKRLLFLFLCFCICGLTLRLALKLECTVVTQRHRLASDKR